MNYFEFQHTLNRHSTILFQHSTIQHTIILRMIELMNSSMKLMRTGVVNDFKTADLQCKGCAKYSATSCTRRSFIKFGAAATDRIAGLPWRPYDYINLIQPKIRTLTCLETSNERV